MDIRWSNNGSSGWNDYNNQQNNLYALPNYNLDVSTFANKYFQIRSRRTDGTNTVYSSYYNANPYPLDVTDGVRPDNFIWTTTITQGGNIYQTDLTNKILYIITAAEWVAFTAKINAFRVYKGLSAYSFISVSSGTEITKAIINDARTAINDIGDRTVYLPAVRATGDIINEAYVYNQLKDSLNSTP
jgi:hypothetical protein